MSGGPQGRGRVRVRVLPFLVVFVISLPILFAPAAAVPRAATGVDKIVHVALFAALALTALAAFAAAVLPVTLALLGYAAASEVVQGVPAIGRTTSMADWLADATGVAIGLAVAGLVALLAARADRSRSSRCR